MRPHHTRENQMRKTMLLTALLASLLLLSACELEVPATAPADAAPEPTVTLTETELESVPADQTPEPMSEAAPTPTAELETAQAGPPAVLVTGAVVNVRAGPSVDHDVLATVVQSEALVPAGRNESGSWMYVELPEQENRTGWIYAPLTDIDTARLTDLSVQAFVAIQPAAPTAVPTPPAAALAHPLTARWEEWWRDSNIRWNPPGTYSPTLPGLDYDFELIWRDESEQWDWDFVDPEGCCDALRVYLSTLPRDMGVKRYEVTLVDIPVTSDLTTYHPHDYATWIHGSEPFINKSVFEELRKIWPDWEGDSRLFPQQAAAQGMCLDMPVINDDESGYYPCEVQPLWGESEHPHLNGVALSTLGSAMGGILFGAAPSAEWRGNAINTRRSYLYPHVNKGPVGTGACFNLIRVE